VADAETVLFVDDEQTQFLEGDIFLQEPVSTDHDIDSSFFHAFEYDFLLAGRTETGQHLNGHRIGFEPLAETFKMLLCEHCSRHENRDLPAVHGCLERCPHGHLCLAVSNVSTDEPVHGTGALHVTDHIFDGAQLVRGFLVGEGRFELAKEFVRRCKGNPLVNLAGSIDPEQLFRHFLDRFASLGLLLFPACSAQLV